MKFFDATMDKTIFSHAGKVLCTLLRDTRTELGLRQQDLADRLGEPQSFVSKFESGERRLDVIELYQICFALGVPFSTFIEKFEKNLHESR